MTMRLQTLLIFFSLIVFNTQAQEPPTNEWRFVPSLKYDAFYFLHAVSKEEHYNRLYQRDFTLWRSRLGNAVMDTINAITDSISIGFHASYLFTYVPASSLADIIAALEDPATLEQTIHSALVAHKDFRYDASINYLKRILTLREKLIFVFRRMQQQQWEDDWRAISARLIYDIKRQQPLLTQYAPSFLKKQVVRFLGIDASEKDSSSTVYYLYYAFPNAFKLPFNMMATWSIEEPKYFFSGYLHEMLHLFSIQTPEFADLHNRLVAGSPSLTKQREILVKQLFESDDEFYVLAAEAYLSVTTGIRTHEEAVDYLKSCQGGTAIYSLLIYNHLRTHLDEQRHSFGSFLKDVFFKKVSSTEVEKFIATTK
jgi:hypothetical protein